MATMAAARSVFRSTSARSAAAKFASAAKTSSPRSAFRSPSASNLLNSSRIFRCPAELSACLDTMQPFHTATASALLTSMLAVSCRSNAWAPDGI
ncbi:hypothetical protein RND81_09G085500 [Saponaria officinalis]|uniref:Protein NUCLEAR FUSION DEFECTIVE 6, chloroplastic/mitochondrial-like n=1 Tax=Saponaria officinalis TaxID=3572 RepID=A0AAW1IIB6_SAPOF